MAGSDQANSIPVPLGRDRLDSWKEIAVYLNRGVRTVQRWEQEEGLPVHRLSHEKRGTVHAYKQELDEWWKSRASELGGDAPDVAAGPEGQGSFEVPDRTPLEKRRTTPLVAAISLALIIVAAAGTWLFRRETAPKPERLTQITADSGIAAQPALSPDGKLIAYVSDRGDDGSRDLWVQQIQGGQAVRAAKGPVFAPAFSPDSTGIVYSSTEPELGIYEVPALGGQPRLVVPRGRRARFSPDGRWMSYIVSSDRLLLMSQATGDSREIQTGLGRIDEAIWSPDSIRILALAVGGEHGEQDWWVIDAQHGNPVRTGAVTQLLGKTSSAPVPMLWLPGNEIVYWTTPPNLWKIHLSPGDWRLSGEPVRLMTGTGQEVAGASFAAGRLAFASGINQPQLWMLPADVNRAKALGPPRRLTRSGMGGMYPSLSADGKKLAFVSPGRGDLDVFLRDLENGSEMALAATAVREQYSAISRDGTKVAYGTVVPDAKRPVFVIPAIGGPPRRICEDCGGRPTDWSPDGSALLLSRITPPRNRVALLNIASGQPTDILVSREWSVASPRFSPDGKWIAFVAANGSGARLVIAPFHGAHLVSEEEWIPAAPAADRLPLPFWSPNGRLLYWLTDRTIEAQTFDSSVGSLTGRPSTVYRFQENEIQVFDPLFSGPTAGPDKIIFVLADIRTNIWTMDLDTASR